MDMPQAPQQQPGMPPQAPQMPLQVPQQDPSAAMPGQNPVTPEARQVLLKKIEAIQAAMADAQAVMKASDGKSDATRQALLQDVFQKLQLAGVDLTDRKSVSDFLSNLRAKNPVMAQNFEKAMDFLLGAAPSAGAEMPGAEMGV